MLVVAVLLLPTGLLSLGLGLHLRSEGQRQGKGRKKGKGKGKVRPTDPTGFIVGGILVSLAGIGCLAASLFG